MCKVGYGTELWLIQQCKITFLANKKTVCKFRKYKKS